MPTQQTESDPSGESPGELLPSLGKVGEQPFRHREPQRRVIASVTLLEGLPEGEQSTVSPAWAKGESSSAPDRGNASEMPQSATPRDEAQKGMVQVTPVLAQRPRVRGGS